MLVFALVDVGIPFSAFELRHKNINATTSSSADTNSSMEKNRREGSVTIVVNISTALQGTLYSFSTKQARRDILLADRDWNSADTFLPMKADAPLPCDGAATSVTGKLILAKEEKVNRLVSLANSLTEILERIRDLLVSDEKLTQVVQDLSLIHI